MRWSDDEMAPYRELLMPSTLAFKVLFNGGRELAEYVLPTGGKERFRMDRCRTFDDERRTRKEQDADQRGNLDLDRQLKTVWFPLLFNSVVLMGPGLLLYMAVVIHRLHPRWFFDVT